MKTLGIIAILAPGRKRIFYGKNIMRKKNADKKDTKQHKSMCYTPLYQFVKQVLI